MMGLLTRQQEIDVLYRRRRAPTSMWNGYPSAFVMKACEECVDELINFGVLKVADSERPSSELFWERTPQQGVIHLDKHDGHYTLWHHGQVVWRSA